MDENKALRAYMEANRRVQAEAHGGQQITMAVLNTFLGAALWGDTKEKSGEPLTLEDLGERLGIPASTVSLHMRYLGDKYRAEADGLDVVATDIYPLNRRKKTFRLTPKGRALAQQLAYIIGEHDASKATR